MSSQRFLFFNFYFFFKYERLHKKTVAGFNFKPPQISGAVTPLFTASCEKPTPGLGVWAFVTSQRDSLQK